MLQSILRADIQLFQLRLSRRQGKRSNTSAKGLSGKISFIPEYITIHRFSTKFKIRSCFLMNINHGSFYNTRTTISRGLRSKSVRFLQRLKRQLSVYVDKL